MWRKDTMLRTCKSKDLVSGGLYYIRYKSVMGFAIFDKTSKRKDCDDICNFIMQDRMESLTTSGYGVLCSHYTSIFKSEIDDETKCELVPLIPYNVFDYKENDGICEQIQEFITTKLCEDYYDKRPNDD